MGTGFPAPNRCAGRAGTEIRSLSGGGRGVFRTRWRAAAGGPRLRGDLGSTGSHYTDPVTLAPGVAAVWKYRAIYLKGDHVFGQWSDVVSIAVTG